MADEREFALHGTAKSFTSFFGILFLGVFLAVLALVPSCWLVLPYDAHCQEALRVANPKTFSIGETATTSMKAAHQQKQQLQEQEQQQQQQLRRRQQQGRQQQIKLQIHMKH
eukprot:4605531-Amphidinium_carterae.1